VGHGIQHFVSIETPGKRNERERQNLAKSCVTLAVLTFGRSTCPTSNMLSSYKGSAKILRW